MYISQRTAATQLRCGGIFRKHFITNRMCRLKNFENRSILGDE